MSAKAASTSRLTLPPANAEWITVSETAAILRCSVKTVRRHLDRRDFPFHKNGGRIRVYRPDLDAFMARGRVEAVNEWDF